jgi:hypothetical protein
MDITIKHNLDFIRRATPKEYRRVRSAIKTINTEIGGLRLTAMMNKGTNLSRICDRKANALEAELNESLKKGVF